jgi:cytochrome c5
MKRVSTIRLSILALPALVVVGMTAASTPAWADCGYNAGDWKAGNDGYHQTCIACHGENGRGTIPGAPDFTRKDGVLSKSHPGLLQRIKNGFISPGASLAMPPKGGNPDLSDKDINDVLAYMHRQFGCG